MLSAIGIYGALRLQQRCASPPEAYNGAIEIDMSNDRFDHHLGSDMYHYLETYGDVKALNFNSSFLNCHMQELSKALVNKSYGITKLNFGGIKLRLTAVNELSMILRRQSNIRTLHLNNTYIGPEEVKVICDALSYNNSIETLDLSGNNFNLQCIVHISNFLRINASLTSLDLGCNNIGDEGALLLAQSLRPDAPVSALGTLPQQYNKNLKSLNIEKIGVGDNGVFALCDMLRVNTSLTYLSVVNNCISDLGCIALANMLFANSILTSLDVGLNSIGSIGLLVIAEGIRVNKGLTNLDLGGCSVNENNDNFIVFIDALCANRTLQMIRFRSHDMYVESAVVLAEILYAKGASAHVYLDERRISIRNGKGVMPKY